MHILTKIELVTFIYENNASHLIIFLGTECIILCATIDENLPGLSLKDLRLGSLTRLWEAK